MTNPAGHAQAVGPNHYGVDDLSQPPLKPLHSNSSICQTKLDQFRKVETQDLIESLRPNKVGALKAKPDGTIMDGHHRVLVLQERGVDVDALPREVLTLGQSPQGKC